MHATFLIIIHDVLLPTGSDEKGVSRVRSISVQNCLVNVCMHIYNNCMRMNIVG